VRTLGTAVFAAIALACVYTLALVLEQVRGNSRDPERCVAARFENLELRSA
jgi:hypothetical protein